MAPKQEGDVNLSSQRTDWQRCAIDAATRELVNRDASAFLHQSLSSPCLNAINRVEGPWIMDTAGRRYLDFHGNNVHHIGYAHPELIAAAKEQLDALSFCPRRYTNEPAVLLAEKLIEIAPSDLAKVLFTTGGSDAIDVAIKLARVATGRFKTLSFWDAFHGAGFGGSSVGGESTFRGHGLGPMLPGAEHVAPFACYRCPYGHSDIAGQPNLDSCGMACAEMISYVLEKEGDVAAVIAEPVRAVPYIPPPKFWKQVRKACDAHGTLLIFDEIPHGLGKTGRLFVSEHFDVVPDITVIGKALGGAMLPVAAIIARHDLDIAPAIALGHYTHEKNPITTRVALTTLQIIQRERLVQNAAKIGAYALRCMREMQQHHRVIGDVRGLGLLLGIELVEDRERKKPAHELAEKVLYAALNRGLSFKTTMGNVLTLTPPLIVTQQQMDQALDIIDSALRKATA